MKNYQRTPKLYPISKSEGVTSKPQLRLMNPSKRARLRSMLRQLGVGNRLALRDNALHYWSVRLSR